MNVHFSGQHFQITDAIREHMNKKIKKLSRHFDHLVDVHINFKIENKKHFAEAAIQLNKQKLFATAISDDMYVTIDHLVDKLDRQLIKHKEKVTNHNNREVEHHQLRK